MKRVAQLIISLFWIVPLPLTAARAETVAANVRLPGVTANATPVTRCSIDSVIV